MAQKINNNMPLPHFSSWLKYREIKQPEADRLVPIITQAGPQGMTRGQIGGLIALERDALDELLDGFVRFGQLRIDVEDGIRVYRAANPTVIGR